MIKNHNDLYNFWNALPYEQKRALLLAEMLYQIEQEGTFLSHFLLQRIAKYFRADLMSAVDLAILNKNDYKMTNELFPKLFEVSSVSESSEYHKVLEQLVDHLLTKVDFLHAYLLVEYLNLLNFRVKINIRDKRKKTVTILMKKTVKRIFGLILIIIVIWGVLSVIGVIK